MSSKHVPRYDEPEPEWFPNEGDRQWWREKHEIVTPHPSLEKAVNDLAWCCTYFCDWYDGRKYQGLDGGTVAYTLVSGIRVALAEIRNAASALNKDT